MTTKDIELAAPDMAKLQAVRDIIVGAVAEATRVPISDIIRAGGRRTMRATDARALAMYVLSNDVDKLGVSELIDLFGTTSKTIEAAWAVVEGDARLKRLAQDVIDTHRATLDSLPVIREAG